MAKKVYLTTKSGKAWRPSLTPPKEGERSKVFESENGIAFDLQRTEVKGGGVVPPAPTQPQLIASMTGIPNGAPVAFGAYTRAVGRNGHTTGKASASSIQIVDVAFRVLSGSGQEVSTPANNFDLQRAIEVAGVTTRATYGGQNVRTVAPGDIVISDVVTGITLPADGIFQTRWEGVVPLSTDSFAAIGLVGPDSQGFRTNSASPLMSTGALNASGTGAGPARWPALILGVPSEPMASVVAPVDSIGSYLNDLNNSTAQGAWTRAFSNIGGHVVPLHKQGVQANSMSQQSVANAPLQKLLWKYHTDLFMQLGTNDIPGLTGTTAERLAVLQGRFSNIVNHARSTIGPYGYRLRIHASSIIPRDWGDANREAVRLAYNGWLAAGADGLVDKFYDLEAAAGPYSSYSDGIHPPTASHIAMAAVIAEGFAPFVDPYYLHV
jgi:hypothetical protein